jgi:putative redox protein
VVLYLQEHGVDVEQLSNKLTYTLTDDEARLYQSAKLQFSAKEIGTPTGLLSSAAQQAVSHHCHVSLMLKPAIEISYSVEVISR